MALGSTLEIESPRGHHTIHVPADASQRGLTDLLRRAAMPLNTRCGERGLCDGCMVALLSGEVRHIGSGRVVAAMEEPIMIRGCEHRLEAGQSLKLRIAARSLLAYEPRVVTEFSVNVAYAHSPLHQRIAVARIEGDAAEAVLQAVAEKVTVSKRIEFAPEAVKQLRKAQGKGELHVTVEHRGQGWLISRVSVERPARSVGCAIDVGTTTVALLLVDLSDGRILGKTSGFNQQMGMGDDVVTRISLCLSQPEMVKRLQEAVANRTIAPLLEQAMAEAGVARDEVACITVAGNTTMLHLVAGADPSPMGVTPFTPGFVEHRVMGAAEVFGVEAKEEGDLADEAGSRRALPCPPTAAVHLLPSAAAYIGADLTAGIVASGLLYDEGPSLLVDVGTNGEIILKYGDRLLGCATAAGPAFEGTGLSSGMRAGNGAISRIALEVNPFEVRTQMIGQEKRLRPAGICGSAYVDFLAEGKRIGLLVPAGRFDRSAVPDAAERLIPWNGNDVAFRLAHTDHGQSIVISQWDVAKLLQAKAAIAAGILILLRRAGLEASQVRRVYLAGGFGTHMDVGNAIACGLLPGFRAEQVQSVGNTALAGAYIAMMDSTLVEAMSRIGKLLEVVELNLEPDFEGTYIDQLLLPEAG